MKQGAQKAKGNKWEREVCAILSLWVTDGESKDVFARSAGSGSTATRWKKQGQARKLANQAGDIVAVDPRGRKFIKNFLVECKFWAEVPIDKLIYGVHGAAREYWGKPFADALRIHKQPLCMVKANRKKPLVLTTEKGSRMIQSGAANPEDFPVVAVFPQVGMYVHDMQSMMAFVNYDHVNWDARRRRVRKRLDD